MIFIYIFQLILIYYLFESRFSSNCLVIFYGLESYSQLKSPLPQRNKGAVNDKLLHSDYTKMNIPTIRRITLVV